MPRGGRSVPCAKGLGGEERNVRRRLQEKMIGTDVGAATALLYMPPGGHCVPCAEGLGGAVRNVRWRLREKMIGTDCGRTLWIIGKAHHIK